MRNVKSGKPYDIFFDGGEALWYDPIFPQLKNLAVALWLVWLCCYLFASNSIDNWIRYSFIYLFIGGESENKRSTWLFIDLLSTCYAIILFGTLVSTTWHLDEPCLFIGCFTILKIHIPFVRITHAKGVIRFRTIIVDPSIRIC